MRRIEDEAARMGLLVEDLLLLARLDQGSALALLLLASAYETGDYLVGSGARNPYEGPAAGASAIVVVTFIISTLPISALGFGEAWLMMRRTQIADGTREILRRTIVKEMLAGDMNL